MSFDPENKIVQLCAAGMGLEAEGKSSEAKKIFLKAWGAAVDDYEKFIAAHYVARHQESVPEKLAWDESALYFALRIEREDIKASYPSLYLNIAKCHEDLGDIENAGKNYWLALTYADLLPEEGYGKMIRSGILAGLDRISRLKKT